MKIQVIGEDVDVKLCNDSELNDGKNYAVAVLGESEIKLARKLNDQLRNLYLLHELFHYCEERMVLTLGEDNVKRLASFMLSLINDNPHIFSMNPNFEEE